MKHMQFIACHISLSVEHLHWEDESMEMSISMQHSGMSIVLLVVITRVEQTE